MLTEGVVSPQGTYQLVKGRQTESVLVSGMGRLALGRQRLQLAPEAGLRSRVTGTKRRSALSLRNALAGLGLV